MTSSILNDSMADGANLTYFECLIEFLTGYNYYFGAGYSILLFYCMLCAWYVGVMRCISLLLLLVCYRKQFPLSMVFQCVNWRLKPISNHASVFSDVKFCKRWGIRFRHPFVRRFKLVLKNGLVERRFFFDIWEFGGPRWFRSGTEYVRWHN